MIMMSIEIWSKMFLFIYLLYDEDHCHNWLFLCLFELFCFYTKFLL